MRKNMFIRCVRYNFVKMRRANSEVYSGGYTPRICISLQEGPAIAAKAETHGSNCPGGMDLRLEQEDLRHCFLVPITVRANLLPAAALVRPSINKYRHVDYSQRKYSSASEISVDAAGIVQVELAQTGEGIADCELLKWYVREGDKVDEFQLLCEVQSDKASVEITSRYKGRVTKVNFIPGDIVKVGETLLELITEGKDLPTSDGPSEKVEDKEFPSTSLIESPRLDVVGRAVQTTPIVRHLAKSYGINIADVPGSGNNGRILKEDVIKFVMSKQELNEEMRMIEPDRGTDGTVLQFDSSSESSDSDVEVDDRRRPKGDRTVSNEDPADEVSVAMNPVIEDVLGKDTIIPVRGFRRIMAKTMTAAVAVPHLYYTEDIKVDALVRLKDSLKDMTFEPGVRLTYLPFLLKALSLALKQYPIMNSSVNEDISEITLRASHNIGVGMATSSGLVVPNIKNVQNLTVLKIAEELSRLTQSAATNKLSNEDVTGGTVTVSNFGSIGGKYGSPVLNLPEVAIVAIGRIQKVPSYAGDGSIYPASIMGVTWGADHRVVDGATVARFCNTWKLLIEQPGQFLLNMR